jgi:hypothetical protein
MKAPRKGHHNRAVFGGNKFPSRTFTRLLSRFPRALPVRGLEEHMRVFLGMILGALLTVAVAYYSDSMRTSSVASGPAATDNKPMVNWDVVEANWNVVVTRAQQGWADLRARVNRG